MGEGSLKKLKVGGELINNPAAMLETCANYIEGQAKYGGNNSSFLNDLKHQLECLFSKSFLNKEQILDVPFTVEEVESTVSHLKKRKSPGPNGLVAEHLQDGRSKIVKWLTRILNNVIKLEAVPEVLKSGPIYKGSGKDLKSYEGITITSVISKVFECLLLSRMEPTFGDEVFPT